MTTMDFNSDQFMQLLTDALRGGPGTPAWHEAVARIKVAGTNDTDEYQLLLTAREHLESGKAFREVRAGPRFTRKVMDAVEGEQENTRAPAGLPTPAIIAIVAGVVGLAAIVLILFLLLSGGRSQAQMLAELQSQTFTHEVMSASFGSNLPSGWRQIGSLAPTFDHEFRPPVISEGRDFGGCGIVATMALPSDQPAEIVVTFRLPQGNQAVIPQVFVTDQADFNANRGTSSHELLLNIQPIEDHDHIYFRPQVVLPDGTFKGTGAEVRHPRDTFAVRIPINGDYAIVESDGKRLFAGPHGLASDKPHFVGVRFLRRSDMDPKDLPAVVSVRVSKG
ncbi:MAG: hypothetical protein M3O30_02945 [Planctomycetota bacterium]|nr:hypothetical protein [Planctomycetota bacterium]